MTLAGKNILITGAGKRIGREIALELAHAGADILIHYHRSSKEARSLAAEIEKLGSKAYLCQADFSKASLTHVRGFIKKLPVPVNALVNSASVFYPVPLGKINDANWDEFMNVNLKAPVLLAQELGLQMAKLKFGRIVNITDLAGENPFPNFLSYSASKAGLISVTKGLARDLAPYVLVNAVSPGPILEPPYGMSSAAKKKVTDATLLKRFGKPRDIAQAVRFLIEADYITGQVIRIDGGKSIA